MKYERPPYGDPSIETYRRISAFSPNGFVIPVVKDPNLEPDEVLNEVEMLTISDSNVVVRSGPSKEYDRVTVLAPGILVYALGTKGDWTYIRYYDHYGWIFSELLEPR